MILETARIRILLAEALRQVDAPPVYGAALEGSIAEGFGNDSSDVDFLLVAPEDREFPTMPTLLFVDGHRVEVRLRSVATVRAEAERVARLASSRGGLPRIEWDLLDRCVRFARALPLGGEEHLAAARVLSSEELAGVVSAWFAQQARHAARYAVALRVLGEEVEAWDWVRTALTQAAKSWAAARGEAYLAYKWLSPQLDRIPSAPELQQRFRALAAVRPGDVEPHAFVGQCLAMVAELGVDGCAAEPDRVVLRRHRSVTTWQIGARVHVVRRRKQVYALDDAAGRAWRALVFDRPLPGFLAALDAEARGFAAQFQRLGLVSLAWRGGGEIRARGASTLPPATSRPLVSFEGAVASDGRPGIERSPLQAPEFAAAGMSIMWANMMAENAREDSMGARRKAQWDVLESSLRRMLREACTAALSAFGVIPLPPKEEACNRLADVPGLRALGASAASLERSVRVADEESARRMLERVEEELLRIRDATQHGVFPACFDSADEWRNTLDIGYDWVRLGAYLDAEFPIDEARDLLASGGQQPSLRSPRSDATAA